MKLYILITILLSSVFFSQESLSKNSFIDDYNFFIKSLEETHPDPYSAFGGYVNFKRKSQDLRNTISDTTDIQSFQNSLLEFISSLNDGHSNIFSLNKYRADTKHLPLSIKIASDGLFISNTNLALRKHIGSRILKINKKAIPELLKQARKLRPSENIYGEYFSLLQLLNNNQNFQSFFNTKTNEVEFLLEKKNGKLEILQISYEKKPILLVTQSNLKITSTNDLIHGQFLDEQSKIAYFSWNSFNSRESLESLKGYNAKIFDQTLDFLYTSYIKIPKPKDQDEALAKIPALYEVFSSLLRSMKTHKSEFLIIDLRKNHGGMTPLCLPLLYMLYADDYLMYQSSAEYNTKISPLVLKKWKYSSIEDYNKNHKTNYSIGDIHFSRFFKNSNNGSIESKRKDLNLISFQNGFGSQYTQGINGSPIYSPHIIILTSPSTYSAAYHFTYLLSEIGKKTSIVGVASRQAGNTFIETTEFELPNTKIKGSISNTEQIFFPQDSIMGKVLKPNFSMTGKHFQQYNFDEYAEVLYSLDLIKHKKIKP